MEGGKMTSDMEALIADYLPANSKTLTEDVKTNVLKTTVASIIKGISDKITSLDVDFINKTSGDIKRLREVDSIQDAIFQLENVVESKFSHQNPTIITYLGQVSKSIFYLNQYSAQFRDAYRTRKTALILKYQTLILSLISSVAYLISAIVDFSDGDVRLKTNPEFVEIAPLKALSNFNKSCENGEFKAMLRDVQIVRESFNENCVEGTETAEALNEAANVTDIVSIVVNGLKNFYNSADAGGKLTGILYRAAGFVATLFSVREALYALSNMKTKARELLDMINIFGKIRSSENSIFGRIAKFAGKFKFDAEVADDMAIRDAATEDKVIMRDANTSNSYRQPEPEVAPAKVASDLKSLFDF